MFIFLPYREQII